jgi:hypothetical protein
MGTAVHFLNCLLRKIFGHEERRKEAKEKLHSKEHRDSYVFSVLLLELLGRR